VDLGAAGQPAIPAAFYSGQLADGRQIQMLFQPARPERSAFLEIEGNPYVVVLDLQTNVGACLEFACGPYSDAERWAVTNLVLETARLPALAQGRLLGGGAAQGLAFAATNIATVEKFSRRHGARLAGRGGGKDFAATWPGFHDGNAFHALLSQRLAAEARGEADRFTAGAYELVWEGLKDGGASWNWEGSVEVRVVWLGTNLVSLCESRYEFTGGAHGTASVAGRNFGLEAGKVREFELADLFRPGVDWTNALAAACLRELRSQKAAWTLPDAPAGMQVRSFTAADLSSFNVEGRGLIVHFGDYAVAPHSDGLFNVHIGWDELRAWLRPESPVRGLFRP
jgi:hypothetical protein